MPLNTHLSPAFARLLWSDALMLLALMVGPVVIPWWIVHEGGAADLATYGVVVSAVSLLAIPLLSATLGPALAGIALLQWSVPTVYISFGLIGALASLALMVVPGYKAFMALEHHEIEGWYQRAYPKAFETASS